MTLVDDGDTSHHRMRAACRCGSNDGVIATVNGQDTVRCAKCNRYCYNAPRTETNRPRRTVRSRPQVSASQHQRIFVRDRRECFICGRRGGDLHLGHIISLRVGQLMGMTDRELFHDENLVVLCAEHNLGQGSDTLPLPFVVAMLRVSGRTVSMPFLMAVLRARIASTKQR